MLDDLERSVLLAGDRVDWVAKRNLLGALQDEEKLDWSDPWLQAIDLEYHHVNGEEALFAALEEQGVVRRVVSEDEIKAAMVNPPETTRAYFRGRAVARFGSAISALQWDEVIFQEGKRTRTVRLPEPRAEDARLAALHTMLREAKDYDAFWRALLSSPLLT